MKKAEADAEKRKADLEILKIQERSGKGAVMATIGTDVMGFKTTLKDAMKSRGLGGTIRRVACADSSGFVTVAIFWGMREMVEDMKQFVMKKVGKEIEVRFAAEDGFAIPTGITVEGSF